MTTDVMKWLQEVRGISPAVLSALGVKETNHKALGVVAAFPYRRDGKNYAAKFRTVDKRFSSTAGVSRGLYNESGLRGFPELPVVITEGEIDALSVIQAGFDRAVSVPDGWKAEGGSKAALVAAVDDLLRSPYVIVAGDNDETGESLPRHVANLLPGHEVRYAIWPDGCKDANDVLVKHGEGALAQCLNEAKRIDPPGGLITGFSDLPPISEQRVLKVGIPTFDKVVAFPIGDLSVLTGLPGNGKSTFTTWAMERVALNEGIRVGLIGFETHVYRIRDQLARMHYHKAWRDCAAGDREKLISGLDARWRLVHLSEDEVDNNLAWAEGHIRALAMRDHCKLIAIDPWNELEHMPQPGEPMTYYVNFALRYLRRLAKRLEIAILIVAHPAKMRTDSKPKPPTGYDVDGSAAWFNKAGIGLTVHPGERDFAVELVNWKTRDSLLYKTKKGMVEVEFAEAWGLYREVSAPATDPQNGVDQGDIVV